MDRCRSAARQRRRIASACVCDRAGFPWNLEPHWAHLAAAIAALLVLQPDASQATSFLAAVGILLGGSTGSHAGRITAIALAILVAVIAWTRPDPLQPVAEVEGIFQLANTVSTILTVTAALALTAASLSPLAFRSAAGGTHRIAARALSGYFISAGICTHFGAFPVPLVGLGMSFPVGYWLGIALLCAKRSSMQKAAN